jgi:hypothetical protein
MAEIEIFTEESLFEWSSKVYKSMPAEWCRCGRPLIGNARREVELCKFCERTAEMERIEDVGEFVESQPELKYEDG